MAIQVNLINFTVTRSGLEEQLLADVVEHEKPDIEAKKNRLHVTMAADKKQLKDIEDKVLRLLSESKGIILDDEELIAALGGAKNVSDATAERVKESEKMQDQLAKTRDIYRPVAARGSILYFAVASLSLLDTMYQHSLPYFKQLFVQSLRDAPTGAAVAQRIENLLKYQVRSASPLRAVAVIMFVRVHLVMCPRALVACDSISNYLDGCAAPNPLVTVFLAACVRRRY